MLLSEILRVHVFLVSPFKLRRRDSAFSILRMTLYRDILR